MRNTISITVLRVYKHFLPFDISDHKRLVCLRAKKNNFLFAGSRAGWNFHNDWAYSWPIGWRLSMKLVALLRATLKPLGYHSNIVRRGFRGTHYDERRKPIGRLMGKKSQPGRKKY